MNKVLWILLALLAAIIVFIGVLAFVFLPAAVPRVLRVDFTGPSGQPFVNGPTEQPPSPY